MGEGPHHGPISKHILYDPKYGDEAYVSTERTVEDSRSFYPIARKISLMSTTDIVARNYSS